MLTPPQAASAAAVAGGVSRGNAAGSHQGDGTGAAPPPTTTPGSGLVDVNDVLRHSNVLPKDDDGSGEPKRVLILMSDTGGGHRASAQVRGGEGGG